MTCSTHMKGRIKPLGGYGVPLFGILAVALLAPASAKGTLILSLDEISGPDAGQPGSSATEYDPANTEVSYAGTLGDFSVTIDTGFSNESSPGTEATLDIDTLDVKSLISAPVVLQVTLSDDGFTFPGLPGNVLNLASALGTTFQNSANTDTVTFQSTVSDTNSTVSTGLQTSTSPGGGPVAPGSSAPTPQVPFDWVAASYTLQNVTTLTFSTSGEIENVAGSTSTQVVSGSVPEPASLGTLALGGLMLMRRRRSAK